MAENVHVGLIGVGGIGKVHLQCIVNNPQAQLVAVCDVNEAQLRGEGPGINLDLNTSNVGAALESAAKYSRAEELLADPQIEAIHIALPTPQHAEMTIAALRAGKHVLCEKPMALDVEQCRQMDAAAREAGKQLMIGHCLRYWPEYIKTQEIIQSGEYGKVLYARFHRSSGTPFWSWNNWLATGSQSGGVVLDMHIHDVDAALWWFGQPQNIVADGIMVDDLPCSVDATWRYSNGPLVYLHSSWDNNGGGFRYAFKVVMERATIVKDSSTGDFRLIEGGREGDRSRDLVVEDTLAYQNEINDFTRCILENRAPSRVTPESSLLAVATTLEELRQIKEKAAS